MTDDPTDTDDLDNGAENEQDPNARAEKIAEQTERRLTVAEKRALALELRLAGMTYQDIADEVGWKNKSSAVRAINEEIAKIPRESAAQLKTMQLETLNIARISIFAAVRAGDVFALDRLLKVMDHEAKLEGLYDIPDTSASVDVKFAFSDLMKRARSDAQAVRDERAADAGEQ